METTFKDKAHELLDSLPTEATFDDLMHELYELRSVERALADIKAGRLTPHEDAKRLLLGSIKRP